MKDKAFSLAELLVVVILLGVLAAVAMPKYSRVLETHKTMEAEQLLSAVRMEQEQRCVLGKLYQTDTSKMTLLASGELGKNYTVNLEGKGTAAISTNKDYEIKMLSYKTGELCCSGSYCSSLNKNYPTYGVSDVEDECSASIECSGPSSQSCGCNNNGTQTRSCNADGTWSDWGACSISDICSCDPNSKSALPAAETCNGCGTQTPSFECNGQTGAWEIVWSACSISNESECAEQCTGVKSKWDTTNGRCVCPGSYDYYVPSTGACCSFQTDKSNSSCWKADKTAVWTSQDPVIKTGLVFSYIFSDVQCDKTSAYANAPCDSSVSEGGSCTNLGTVCTISCDFSGNALNWKRTEHILVCLQSETPTYTQLWDPNTMHNY